MSNDPRLADSAAWLLGQLFGPIIRRAAWLAIGVFFALIAAFNLIAAAMVALSAAVGALNARLLIAAACVLVAGACVAVFVLTRPRPITPADVRSRRGDEEQHASQVAELVEALTLGYSLARKPKR